MYDKDIIAKAYHIGVVGSRTFDDYEMLEKTLLPIVEKKQKEGYPIFIVSGGARGADSLAEKFADKYELGKVIYFALWDVYGKSAGYIRNADIVNMSDEIVAFWDGVSKGTKHSIDLARTKGKKVTISTEYAKEFLETWEESKRG